MTRDEFIDAWSDAGWTPDVRFDNFEAWISTDLASFFFDGSLTIERWGLDSDVRQIASFHYHVATYLFIDTARAEDTASVGDSIILSVWQTLNSTWAEERGDYEELLRRRRRSQRPPMHPGGGAASKAAAFWAKYYRDLYGYGSG